MGIDWVSLGKRANNGEGIAITNYDDLRVGDVWFYRNIKMEVNGSIYMIEKKSGDTTDIVWESKRYNEPFVWRKPDYQRGIDRYGNIFVLRDVESGQKAPPGRGLYEPELTPAEEEEKWRKRRDEILAKAWS